MIFVGAAGAACAERAGRAPPTTAPKVLVGKAQESRADEVLFTGMCDASGAVALTERLVLVADDEDNVLRVYDADRGGAPTSQVDLSTMLRLPTKPAKTNGAPAPPPEVDIEAATRLGDRAFFIASHGRNARGKLKTERLRFFATNTPPDGSPQLVGEPYTKLLDDLLHEPRLAAFDLHAASLVAPKAPGGLNIEGMTARSAGGVWLGFRNPIPHGRALLIPLLNPHELLSGQRATFGDPRTLDLGGLGIRGLSWWRGEYYIAAGAFDNHHDPELFSWDGADSVRAIGVALAGYNPEAFFSSEDRDQILLLSDDGSSLLGGVECKHLEAPSQKRFRGLWFTPPR